MFELDEFGFQGILYLARIGLQKITDAEIEKLKLVGAFEGVEIKRKLLERHVVNLEMAQRVFEALQDKGMTLSLQFRDPSKDI